MIIGLDCAEPSLVLERWRGRLPTIAGLIEHGAYGRLTSVIPPITVPAWSCMMASRTPGDLGVYGFRNRVDHSYDRLVIADGAMIREPRLWDMATRYGKASIVVGVPGTYPVRPLHGVMVSCLLTPSLQSQYTYPASLRTEVERVVGEYRFDCALTRNADKERLLEQVYEMTNRRFRLAEYLLTSKPWELFVLVEIGLDRMQHGFWSAMDPAHRNYVPDNPYESALLDYHCHLDALVGRLLRHADEETGVLIVSDHGAKRMAGGIRVNEWLRRQGFLATLREPIGRGLPAEIGVDWSRTTAWGEGGYYARVFLNVKGREPEGILAPTDYERVREELARGLKSIPDEQGKPIATKVFRPEQIYEQATGIPPDLIVHFGDLSWRSVGTIGGDEGLHTFTNDTGPDDANHAQDGLLIMTGPGIRPGQRDGMHLLDVAPTVLRLLGLDPPAAMRGRCLD